MRNPGESELDGCSYGRQAVVLFWFDLRSAMHIRVVATTTAAMLLGSVVVLDTLSGAPPAAAATEAGMAALPAGSRGRIALDHCRQNVGMIHDVHWAAACAARADDDSPDCSLPPAQADPLNAARASAEAQCLAEVQVLQRQ
jgi:hypothetical protein